MGLVAKQTGEDFDPPEAGTHHAICYSVVDLGTQHNRYYDKNEYKICVTWELPEIRIQIDKDGKTQDLPRAISKIYTLSLSEKAYLYIDLVSWRGRDFTEEELDGFDVKQIAGANCLLTLTHTVRDKKTYANVAAVAKLMKGMSKREPENPIVIYNMQEDGYDPPDGIPNWIVDKIKQSAEYIAVHKAQLNEDLATAQAAANYAPDPVPENDDGEVPF